MIGRAWWVRAYGPLPLRTVRTSPNGHVAPYRGGAHTDTCPPSPIWDSTRLQQKIQSSRASSVVIHGPWLHAKLARAFMWCCCCVPLQPYARVQSHHCAFRVQIEARDPGTVRRQLLRPLPSHARLSQSQESGTVQVQAGTRPHAHNGENAWARARPPATKALSFVLPRKAH